MNMKIKTWYLKSLSAVIVTAVIMVAAFEWLGSATIHEETAEIVVYKTPSCGCCSNWIAHLQENDLDVSVINMPSTQPIHDRLGVPNQLVSCHTAKVGAYWVEGHVPADLVQRLMTERPEDIRGIAVPGMPMGSPGMEGPNPVEYEVIAYHTDGSTTVYATRQGRSSTD